MIEISHFDHSLAFGSKNKNVHLKLHLCKISQKISALKQINYFMWWPPDTEQSASMFRASTGRGVVEAWDLWEWNFEIFLHICFIHYLFWFALHSDSKVCPLKFSRKMKQLSAFWRKTARLEVAPTGSRGSFTFLLSCVVL